MGKSIGAGQIEEGKQYAKRFFLLVPILGISLGALIILLRGPMISLFDISDTAAHTARVLLLFYAVDVTIRNIPYLGVVGIFRAGGDTRVGLITDLVSHYVFILPAVILAGLVFKLSFLATYIVMLAVDDVSKLVVTIPYFHSMRWIKPITAQVDASGEREEILLQNAEESGIL